MSFIYVIKAFNAIWSCGVRKFVALGRKFMGPKCMVLCELKYLGMKRLGLDCLCEVPTKKIVVIIFCMDTYVNDERYHIWFF